MRLHLRRIAIWMATLAVAGCCGTYKAAVKLDVDHLADTSKVFYQECVVATCGGLSSDIVKAHIVKDAALACLVDSDEGKSNASTKSPACTCSEGTSIDTCKAWLGVQ